MHETAKDLTILFVPQEQYAGILSAALFLTEFIYIYMYIHIYIQGVPGGMCQTSEGCSLC